MSLLLAPGCSGEAALLVLTIRRDLIELVRYGPYKLAFYIAPAMQLTLNIWGLGAWMQCWLSAGAAVCFAISLWVVSAVVWGLVLAELWDLQCRVSGVGNCPSSLQKG